MTKSTKHLDVQLPLNSLGVKPLNTPTVMTKYLKVVLFFFFLLKNYRLCPHFETDVCCLWLFSDLYFAVALHKYHNLQCPRLQHVSLKFQRQYSCASGARTPHFNNCSSARLDATNPTYRLLEQTTLTQQSEEQTRLQIRNEFLPRFSIKKILCSYFCAQILLQCLGPILVFQKASF